MKIIQVHMCIFIYTVHVFLCRVERVKYVNERLRRAGGGGGRGGDCRVGWSDFALLAMFEKQHILPIRQYLNVKFRIGFGTT